jgi:hypothetical protein
MMILEILRMQHVPRLFTRLRGLVKGLVKVIWGALHERGRWSPFASQGKIFTLPISTTDISYVIFVYSTMF